MLPQVETRVCEACLEEKLIIDFYVHSGRNRQPSRLCKQCENKQTTEKKRIKRQRERLYAYLENRFGNTQEGR